NIFAHGELVVGTGLADASGETRLQSEALALTLFGALRQFFFAVCAAPASAGSQFLFVLMRRLRPDAWHATGFAVPGDAAIRLEPAKIELVEIDPLAGAAITALEQHAPNRLIGIGDGWELDAPEIVAGVEDLYAVKVAILFATELAHHAH